MIGTFPAGTMDALGRSILIAAWTWIGCILLCAAARFILAVMAWRTAGRRRTLLGVCAACSGALSVALLLSLLAAVGT